MSRIALIRLSTMGEAYHRMQDFIAILYPSSLLTIASCLEREGHEILVYDADARGAGHEQTVKDLIAFAPDIAGFTVMTPVLEATARCCKSLKSALPGVTTIAGGVHPTALPVRTLQEFPEIDLVVKGEGERTLPAVVRRLAAGDSLDGLDGITWRAGTEIRDARPAVPIRNLEELPFPAFHLLDLQRYRAYGWNGWKRGIRAPNASLYTSRGCYRTCTFCSSKTTLGHGLRYFSVDQVLEQIDYLVRHAGIRSLYFNDDTFVANKRRAAEICEAIIRKGYNLEIMVNARCDEADLDLFRLLRRAGVDWVAFGVESGDQGILDRCRKQIKLEDIHRAFALTRKAGVHAAGNFIFGLPGETQETARKTIQLALELPMDYASFAICIPFPGSDLFEEIESREGQLPSWSGFRLTNARPIPLANLTADELISLRRKATLAFFSRPSYLLRLLKRFDRRYIVEHFLATGWNLLMEVVAQRF